MVPLYRIGLAALSIAKLYGDRARLQVLQWLRLVELEPVAGLHANRCRAMHTLDTNPARLAAGRTVWMRNAYDGRWPEHRYVDVVADLTKGCAELDI